MGGSTPAAGNLSESNQPHRSTQPGYPSVGRRNEYLSKGGDTMRLGVKADIWCCLEVTLCDPYLRVLEAFARRRAIQIHVFFTLLWSRGEWKGKTRKQWRSKRSVHWPSVRMSERVDCR